MTDDNDVPLIIPDENHPPIGSYVVVPVNKPVLNAIMGVLALAVLLVGGIIISGRTLNSTSTPLVTTVLGFFGLAIVALINLASQTKSNHINREMTRVAALTSKRTEKKVDSVLASGQIDKRIAEAVAVAVRAALDQPRNRRATDQPTPPTVTEPLP